MNIRYCFWLVLGALLLNISCLWAQLPSMGDFQNAYELFQQAEKQFYASKMRGGTDTFALAAKAYEGAGSKDGYIAAKAMQALSLVNQGQLEEGFAIFKTPEDEYKKLSNPNNSTVAYLTMCIGKYHLQHQEYPQAMEFLEEALAIADAHPEAVSSVFLIELKKTLADVYLKNGEFRRAIDFFERTIEATEELPPSEIRYDSLGAQKILVADLYYELREVEKAIERYKEILLQKDKYLQYNPVKEGEFLLKIGRAHFQHHEYDTAHSFLSDALNFRIKPLEKADARNMLASIAMDVRDYDEALRQNGRAVQIIAKVNAPKFFAYKVAMKQGHISKAIEPKSKVIDWYKQSTNPPADAGWTIRQELGKYALKPINHPVIPEKNDNFNIALLFYDRAERLVPLLSKSKQPIYEVEVKMAKGKLYYDAKDYAGAQKYYEESLEQMKTIYDDDHPLVSEAKRAIGEIYMAEKQYEKALGLVDESIDASMGAAATFDEDGIPDIESVKDPYELLYGMSAKASLLYRIAMRNPTEQKLLEALKISEIAMELLNRLRRSHRSEGAKYEISELSEHISHQALETCSALHNLTKKETYLDKAFNYGETSKSSILLQTVLQMKARRIAHVPDSVVSQEHRLKVDISYLNGEIYYELKQGKDANQARLEELKKRLAKTRKTHKAYLLHIKEKYPEYYTLKYDYKTIPAKDLQSILAPEEVMLNYVVIDSVIHVLAINSEDIKHFSVPNIPRLHRATQRFLASMSGQKTKAFIRYSNMFYDALLAPIKKLIENKKLIIIPDGELNYIPFGVVMTERLSANSDVGYKKMPYLLRSNPITYNYSATLYAAAKLQDHSQAPAKVIGIAPDFSSMDSIQIQRHQNKYENLILEPLKFTKIEVEKITEIADGVTLTGAEATEAALKKQINDYGVLHFATHGLLNNTNPLYSSLALLSNDKEDGMLHTFELYNMSVNAELVVLSACNTGVGRIHKGEGAMSLARGFAYAGCYNVAMTLWPVSDQPTQMIMTAFYKYLIEGYKKDEALRKAKLDFLDNSSGIVTAPVYWSGLIMVGTPDMVQSLKKMDDTLPWWIWWAIGGFFVLLVIVARLFKK